VIYQASKPSHNTQQRRVIFIGTQTMEENNGKALIFAEHFKGKTFERDIEKSFECLSPDIIFFAKRNDILQV
jgi:hypothetical protein